MSAEDLVSELKRDYPTLQVRPGMSNDKIMWESAIQWLIQTLDERMKGTNMAQLKGDMTI